MRSSRKSLGLLAACAALLSGCATYGYDGYYAYDDRYYERPARYYDYYDPGPRYYYGPPRVYVQPSIGLGFSYHRWRGH